MGELHLRPTTGLPQRTGVIHPDEPEIAFSTAAEQGAGRARPRPGHRAARGENGPCTLRRGRARGGSHRATTPATGSLAAPIGDRLRLLPSGPDLVHGPTSRGDPGPSTPHTTEPTRGRAPREGIRPR